MNILKPGIFQPSKFMFYGKCQHCHCEVEVNRSDMYYIGNLYHVKCPTNGCGCSIKIYEKLIEVDEKNFTKKSPIACCTDDKTDLKDIQVIGPGPLDNDEFCKFFSDDDDDAFPLKKYTIIYRNHTNKTIKKDWVETNNITTFIMKDKYAFGICYIFHGWCQDVML